MAIYDPFLDEDGGDPSWPSERPTVSQLRRWARAALESYAITGTDVDPVREILFTNRVVRSFWGKTWCDNLEHWGASKQKLARGRTHVRCGAVVNLRIFRGAAFARVSGTALYTASLHVEPIPRERWTAIRNACGRRIESLVALAQPDPPGPIREILAHPETGLFPTFGEMKLSCDCHLGRRICVHQTAAMYGIGARLDRSPEELLRLRGLDPDWLTEYAAAEAASPGAREALDAADLSAIFGVSVEDEPPNA